jgi:hypothetical protein
VSADELTQYLNERQIPGVNFRQAHFVPHRDRFKDQPCHGTQILLNDRQCFDSPSLGIEVASALYRLYPKDFEIDKIPSPGQSSGCQWKGVPVLCGPRGLPGGMNILYHNNGDGTFTDVTARAGLEVTDKQYGPLWSVGGGFLDVEQRRAARSLRNQLPSWRMILHLYSFSHILRSSFLLREF